MPIEQSSNEKIIGPSLALLRFELMKTADTGLPRFYRVYPEEVGVSLVLRLFSNGKELKLVEVGGRDELVLTEEQADKITGIEVVSKRDLNRRVPFYPASATETLLQARIKATDL